MSKHPLDDAFNIGEEHQIDEDILTVHIPESEEEQNLALIASLALATYKAQMEDIVHIEPKNRPKFLEVAKEFLAQAKDAIDKKEKLRLGRDKMNAGIKPGKGGEEGETGKGGSVSRKELSERMRLVKGGGK